ncbi:hypothetical protein [Streptomyces sp. TR02-1]|uniref:hypothetical protein n=1 Tax=Streptomyces sp. TR02-1 TaxID=3385977 RepID=UPI00399EEE37
MRGTRLGMVAAATTAAAALLVSGCGSGDGGAGDGSASSSSSSSGSGGTGGSADSGGGGTSGKRPDDGGNTGGADTGGSGSGGAGSGSGSSGGSGGGRTDSSSPYTGSWAAGTKGDGKLLVLLFNKDATVSLAGQNLACQGRLKASAEPARLDMECRDGNDAYASGTLTEQDGDTLTVRWGAGKTSHFRKGAAPVGPGGA